MTFLYILGALVVVIVILLIIALFLPNGYFIEKSAIIKKPCEFVMDKVADFHNHVLWNPWQPKESRAITTTNTPIIYRKVINLLFC